MVGTIRPGKPEEEVFLEIEEGIGTVFVHRPEKRNAISMDMWKKLTEIVDDCTKNQDVKVIIFRSTTAETFSAGADIAELEGLHEDQKRAEEFNGLPLKLEEQILRSPKPSIAMIQGFCVGGGCQIALACDFRFSDPTGKFGITPAKLGLVYNTSGTKQLVDLVGPSHAKDLLFSGRIIGADEALQMGLINRIIPTNQLIAETYHYAKTIAENAQRSIRGAKTIIDQVLQGATDNSEEIEKLVLDAYASGDFKEGVRAFLKKENRGLRNCNSGFFQ